MIGDLYGPMIGTRHDSYLLRKSGLNYRILNMLHLFLPDTVYHTYGDAAHLHLPRWLKPLTLSEYLSGAPDVL